MNSEDSGKSKTQNRGLNIWAGPVNYLTNRVWIMEARCGHKVSSLDVVQDENWTKIKDSV